MLTEVLDIREAITSIEENALRRLVELASHAELFVEIGTWKGHSASIIGEVAKRNGGHLYCVDHWKGNEGTKNTERLTGVYDTFKYNMRSLGLWDYITPLVMESMEAVSYFEDDSIDFLFIDADHRYTPFMNDLQAWYPKVKTGGIICGHDCEMVFSISTPCKKQRVLERFEKDFDGSYHCGVIKGLFDYFKDDYHLAEGTRIWSKIKS